MNMLSNEWLEITTSQPISSMAEPFISPIIKFLYPHSGEIFQLRLIGSLRPYYRTWVNPNLQIGTYANFKQFKGCITGNQDDILAIVKNMLDKDENLSNRYTIDWENKKIKCSYGEYGEYGEYRRKSCKITVEDQNRMLFLNACLSEKHYECTQWYPCVVANVYVRNGTRLKNSIQPMVITKSLFYQMLRSHADNNGIKDVSSFATASISGIKAFDVTFSKDDGGFEKPLRLRMDSFPSRLTYDEVSCIAKQKLLNLNSFTKVINNASVDAFGGFFYRPYKGMKDVSETLRVLKEMQDMDNEEQYESVEKELPNISPELSMGDSFEQGPISGLEID